MLWKQEWIYRERGWASEEDGYSLHLYLSDVQAFIKEYWDKMPDEVPDEYSCPSGNAYIVAETNIPADILKQVRLSRNGVRL